MAGFIRLTYVVAVLVVAPYFSGCAAQSDDAALASAETANPASSSDLQQEALISALEQFVHSNLYTGMIQVWSNDRRSWNQLLNAYACNPENAQQILQSTYQNNLPVFSQVMLTLAQNNSELSAEEENILNDISELAYRLFSASYAQGYARQVVLADEIEPGLREQLCGGQISNSRLNMPNYSQSMNWQSALGSLTKIRLEPHAQFGYSAFNTLLLSQYAQFDALVYSHAYQQVQAYQSLFFEVNKYENVEAYAQQVKTLSSQSDLRQEMDGHNDFAYLVLTSGYHWGMMSVLAMLEEEFPGLHDRKKQRANEEIQKTMEYLNIRTGDE